MQSPIISYVGYSGNSWYAEIILKDQMYFGSGEVWYLVERGTGKLQDVDDTETYSDLMAVFNKAVHMNVRAAMSSQRIDQSPLNIQNIKS